ncbi:T9SS type A sorting domain-containing protein [Chryseobacterium jejuense]|uniref:Delta-60 repeat domain n=1 Tax=Chryseobacterium jejuense TaxID=445960 RepID=A0A2X2WZ06_CHRJE|nr:T9SS type A sorting domain-containing protein [Chryseobacterium jejuense]SDJ67950.1 delta-60 repeat domain-containing protein/Por secretion system C-terminal sorting domain-containing protein [Chryseobacterium jejuense]SQB43043.1 delta-60 repeat domain [Chryseobacterium jejuense]
MTKNLFIVLLLVAQTAFAQIISKDPNFATNGKYPMPGNLTWSMVQNPNGETYFTHNTNASTPINVTATYVSKLTTNGILDTTFGVNGTAQLPNNSYLNEVKIQPDGKLIVFGFINTESTAISRILPNGQPDLTFGTNGTVIVPSLVPDQNYASSGIILQNDKILVHAIKYIQNVQHQHVVFRLNTNGSLDTTFGNSGYTATKGTPAGRTFVRMDNQSNIICFSSDSGFIQKFNSNGQPVTNFGTNGTVPLLDNNGFGYGSTNAVFVDSSNKILFAPASEDKLQRLNQDGTFDTTFNYNVDTNSGLNGGAWIQSITEKEGSYYVGGAGNSINLISKISQSGLVDPLFNDYLQTDSDVEEMFIHNSNIMIRGNGFIVKYLLTNGSLSTADVAKANPTISFENPVKQDLIYQSKEKVSKIEIYYSDGKIAKNIKESGCSVSDLPKGSYIAKVTFENGSVTTKKMIKN